MASLPKFDIKFLSAVFVLCLSFACAERDFNFNDSQILLFEPKDEPRSNQHPYAAEVERCHYTETEIVLSLVLKNHDWSDLSDNKKSKLLDKMSKFFAIPKEFIILESITKRDMYEMQKQSIRKGNNKCHNSRRLGRIDLMIGCGSKYFSMGEPIANQIGQQMRDGSIDNISDQNFGWWIIWRKNYKTRTQRNRRQIEGSGEDDYDDESYDYDDDDEEENADPVTDIPTSTTHSHQPHHGISKDEDIDDDDDYGDDDEDDEILLEEINRDKNASAAAEVSPLSTTTTTTTTSTYYPEFDEISGPSELTTLTNGLSGSSPIPATTEITTTPPTKPTTTTTTTSSTTTATTAAQANIPVTETTTTTETVTTSSTTTTTTTTTEYVEPKIENFPPMIKTRLQKFAVTSGKAFRYIVPADTFYDTEDLTNLRLELTDKDGHELEPTSWLQFNAETHEIYGLPLDDAVSKWQYRLSATDSGNLSVTETLEMSVQQHRGVRSVNHEINIAVKINEKNMPSIDWQLKLIEAIATTLGDESTTNLVVREIRQTTQDPNTATFIYFNETLPSSGACPDTELNSLIQRLDANRLLDLVSPNLSIKSITGQLIGPCQKQHPAIRPRPPTHMSKNLPPVPRNQVDRVNATVGHLLVFKVPSDTFYDPNDNELTLMLRTKDNKILNPRHWLQFDSKNQEFYGIPKSGDIGSEEYLLVAEDSGGLSATDALVVVVNHAPKKDFSVYFKAYLAIRHEQFNADLQRKFVERVAKLFGDRDTHYIQIRSITTHHDADGTIVNFYNTTLHKAHNRCPEEEIDAARNVYLMQDYRVVRDRVKQALGAELNLTNVEINTSGSCSAQTNVIHHDVIPTKTEEPTLKSTFADNYMFTFIVPAVIIVTLILVAAIIACCLHRRRMSGKMELGDEEERKAFRPKGIPVIFQDEFDEKPEIGNKSPIILKDEKPPLLPPSYNTSNMNGGDNDVDEYLPPPAVVVGGREARGKSPATPSYRKPPPYVSP